MHKIIFSDSSEFMCDTDVNQYIEDNNILNSSIEKIIDTSTNEELVFDEVFGYWVIE